MATQVTTVTPERIAECIATGPIRKVENMLLAVYANQTADEQAIEGTVYTNGVGFNGTDANFLTSLAKQVIAHRNTLNPRYANALSTRQESVLRKMLRKYAGQIARSYAPPASVAPASVPTTPPPGCPVDDAALALHTVETVRDAAYTFGQAMQQGTPGNIADEIIDAYLVIARPAPLAPTDPMFGPDPAGDAERNADVAEMAVVMAARADDDADAVVIASAAQALCNQMLQHKAVKERVMEVACEQRQRGETRTLQQDAYALWIEQANRPKVRRVTNQGIVKK